MDTGELTQRFRDYWQKYRWAALILILGLLLMLLPKETSSGAETPQSAQVAEETLQQELESILSRLEGAGKVKVLLSQATGQESHYQTDTISRETMDSVDRQVETVIISSADRSQQGLVLRIDPPQYQGAVVLCQGADRPAVRLAVVEAVGTATGLTSDKISVLKMK